MSQSSSAEFDLSCLEEFSSQIQLRYFFQPPDMVGTPRKLRVFPKELQHLLRQLQSDRFIAFGSKEFLNVFYPGNAWAVKEWLRRNNVPFIEHRLLGHLTIQLTEAAWPTT